MIICNSFTARELKNIGFPIKINMGKARIPNKMDQSWKAGGPFMMLVKNEEVTYQKKFPNSFINQYGMLENVSVFTDDNMDQGVVRLIINEEVKEFNTQQIGNFLDELKNILKND